MWHHVIGQYNLYFRYEKLYWILKKSLILVILEAAPTHPRDQRIGLLKTSSGGANSSAKCKNSEKKTKRNDDINNV